MLFTRAACRNVDIEEAHLLTGDIPFIGPASALQIAEIAVRLCLKETGA